MNNLIVQTPYFPSTSMGSKNTFFEPIDVYPAIINLSEDSLYLSLERYKPVEDVYSICLSNVQFMYPLIQKKNTPEKEYFAKTEIIIAISNFLNLSYNWDGYNSIPLCIDSANNSRIIIELLPNNLFKYFYDVYPNPHGTISLEWKNTNNEFYLEVGNTSVSFYLLEGENLLVSKDKMSFGIDSINEIRNTISRLNG